MKTELSSPALVPRLRRGFTLIEMLTVIAIIGILAAVIGPSLGNFKPNVTAAATQQLLADIGRARQLAISQHTTVYMVFLPPGFALDPACAALRSFAPLEWAKCLPLLDKQLTGYNFVSLRSVGDQPGRHTVHYWSAWKTLPEGAFIPLQKFAPPTQSFNVYTNVPGVVGNVRPFMTVSAFSNTLSVPFPSEQTPPIGPGTWQHWTSLPYIAFNYLGQLVQLLNGTETLRPANEIIPVAKGSVLYPHDPATKLGNPALLPTALEVPVGNSTTNSFNLICIDRLTGRTYVKRQEVR
ncbi:MAG: Tfp pilus assembly protein FimT/FimU [Limisphaerales bacterium]